MSILYLALMHHFNNRGGHDDASDPGHDVGHKLGPYERGGSLCFPGSTYLSQWPCGFQRRGRPEGLLHLLW